MGKDSGKFSSLKVNKLDGDKGKLNMDIDASRNTNNSDRLYIAGTHTATITLRSTTLMQMAKLTALPVRFL